MKVRSQRTHYMGASNREAQNLGNTSNYKTQSVFERSFNKSKSLFTKEHSDLYSSGRKQENSINDRHSNPFLGTHNQFQTQRFDKLNVKPYKYQKMIVPMGRRTITFAPHLNSQVKNIHEQFANKKINMHKLKQLKQAFVKNNKDRKNLQSYFNNFSKQGAIDADGLKKLVKQFGFDVNEDEAKLIFKLTNNKLKRQGNQEENLDMEGFVELMTRDDIYFKTLQLNKLNRPQFTFQNNFSQKVFQVLRNKFPRLKEAFKIYRQRNQQIGIKEYEYVMKKLDLTDLVLTSQERSKIFNDYSDQNGTFNVQGLICAIAEQQNMNKRGYATDFIEDLQVNKQYQFSQFEKKRKFDLKNLSSLQYENQYKKARSIIQQLKRVNKQKEGNNKNLFKNIQKEKVMTRQQFLTHTEKLLKSEGVNFHKQDYDALGAYLNYDVNDKININKINHIVFTETEKNAQDRFQRKIRSQAPHNSNIKVREDYHQKSAIDSIMKLKAHKMNPETRQLFKILDEDKDGYVSQKQFKQKINSMQIMENWEIDNLANYLKIDRNGSIDFQQFSKKINEDHRNLQKQLPLVRSQNSRSCYEWADTTKNKKSLIKTANMSCYQRPTKFSAWPMNLTSNDLSLVQPPPNAGMYSTQADRFGERKQDYGMKEKLIVKAIAQGKKQKIQEWNRILQERAELTRQKQEERAAAKNYALRLTKQKYEFNCHQG